MKIFLTIIQVLALILVSPFLSGLIRKIKNILRMRKGQGVFQPYRNIVKLLRKDEVVSCNSSWIFKITPYIVLASTLAVAFLVPILGTDLFLRHAGDLIVIIFLFALGRFFIALAGIDTGSAFGGMGSSREVFISGLMEPVMLLSFFTVSMNAGSTSMGSMGAAHAFRISSLMASAAFFIVIIAETSRIPVDNQETHLELTMVHEAMVLEYSGRSLAMIEIASYVKQAILFSLLINMVLPWHGIIAFAMGILFVSLLISIVELSVAKMRLFRVVDLSSFSFIMALISVIISAIGF